MTHDVDPDELAADLQREANGHVEWEEPNNYRPPLETLVGWTSFTLYEKGNPEASITTDTVWADYE